MTVYVRRGWTVEVLVNGDGDTGACAYLAVAGGIDVPQVMGSRSTYLPGAFGGLQGRALQAGDLLSSRVVAGGPHLPALAGRRLPTTLLPAYTSTPTLHAVAGPQEECFSEQGLEAFYSGPYRISSTSDRMGYRLCGPDVAHSDSAGAVPGAVLSDGIPLGAVQVPAGGQPIVMLADRQTTGGYPKIACVASASIPQLAQCIPGRGGVRFQAVPVQEAQHGFRRLLARLDRWAAAS
jgi:antagonist of KipI